MSELFEQSTKSKTEFTVDKLVDTWKLEITFDEVINFVVGDSENPTNQIIADEIKKIYKNSDPHFKRFLEVIINQAFLVGKLHGGEEVKNIIGTFLSEKLGLDKNLFGELNFLERASKKDLDNAKSELSKRQGIRI